MLLSGFVLNRNSVDLFRLDDGMSANYWFQKAATFYIHSDFQTDFAGSFRFQVEKITGVQDATVDLAMQGVVQSLNASAEPAILVLVWLVFLAVPADETHESKYVM